jgi:hypothetical protein
VSSDKGSMAGPSTHGVYSMQDNPSGMSSLPPPLASDRPERSGHVEGGDDQVASRQ